MSTYQTQEWETLEMERPGETEWGSEAEYENQEQFGGLLGSVFGGELESPIGEMQEMELASELLEISSEAELEQFLGRLIKGASRAVGGFIKSPVGRALGGALKNVARTALPMAAGALGNLVAPGVGGMIGSKLGSMASSLFEFEFEGMNERQAEFEAARRYVRFASAAARHAARAPSGTAPRAVARAAVVSAARRHAPGLVRGQRLGGGQGMRGPGRPSRHPQHRSGTYGFDPAGGSAEPAEPGGWDGTDAMGETAMDQPQTGRWMRRGRKIVIYGI